MKMIANIISAIGFAVACASGITVPAFADALTLCGVLDNSPNDLDPALGSVSIGFCNFGFLGSGTFSGEATEVVTPTLDRITITGTFTGQTFGLAELASNTYPATFKGPGTLSASIVGQLEYPGMPFSSGGEFFTLQSNATTFNNSPADATVSFPKSVLVPSSFSDSETRSGSYGGAGSLIVNINFFGGSGATGNGRFVFPGSGVALAEVPESTTFVLVGIGMLGTAYVARQRRIVRSQPS